jgi:hypothetical protein
VDPNAPAEAVYEMVWDCKYCGHKKLLGLTHRFCASCGAPQDPSARYFPPDHEKVAVKDHPFVGADVACPACKQPMSRAAKCCTNCGSPIDKGAEVAQRADVVVPPPGMTPLGMVATPAPKKSNTLLFAILGGVGLLVVIGILVMIFWRREGVFEVTAHAWERNIAIERYDAVRKTVWCDEAPAGSRELSRKKEQRGTKQEKDGETCQMRKKDQGNGTYKEVKECTPKYKDVPQMSDRCEVELTEWKTSRTLTEKGASPKDPPRWPNVTLARSGTCLGCEREGARTEKYTLKLVDTKSKSEASCELPEKKWASFGKGSKWKGKVRVMTGGVDCEALSPP